MPINIKNIHDATGIEVFINSNLNFTIWASAWCVANDHILHKKYEKIAKYITLSNLI